MRPLRLSWLAVAITLAIPYTAPAGAKKQSKAEKEAKRLETANFSIILIVDSDASKRLEACETSKVAKRRKSLTTDYKKAVKLWSQSYATFCKNVENRGKKFRDPRPTSPRVTTLRRNIRGKKAADEQLKTLNDNWLKPILEKEKAQRKVREEAAAKARGTPRKIGGGAARKVEGNAGAGGRAGAGRTGPPRGNLVKNGGFEEGKSDGGLTRFWAAGQWGGTGKKSSVRISRTESHQGDRAIVLRVLSDGAKPGAFTSLRLPAATYEVRYWACCDVDKVAVVSASLAGKNLGDGSVSEDWKQFKQTVTIEEKVLTASLKIWTDTPRVRVFIDDVEVEAVK